MITGLELFGFTLPLWAFLIIGLIAIVIIWKLIKFAIKVLITIIVFFAILIGLDVIGVFSWIQQNIFQSLL